MFNISFSENDTCSYLHLQQFYFVLLPTFPFVQFFCYIFIPVKLIYVSRERNYFAIYCLCELTTTLTEIGMHVQCTWRCPVNYPTLHQRYLVDSYLLVAFYSKYYFFSHYFHLKEKSFSLKLIISKSTVIMI